MNAERHHLVPTRVGFVRTAILLIVAVASIAGSIGFNFVAPVPSASAAEAPPARDAVHVRITAAGFEPSTVNVIVGQTVIFDNETGGERSVVASDGVFDSGAIPAEGAFAVAMSQPGTFEFASPGDPELRGVLAVGLVALPGSGTAKVVDAVPALTPTPTSDLAPHPDYVIKVSRSRLIVVPSATATVADFNALLAANELTIVGGLKNLKELVVATADSGDHSLVIAAAEALRASSLVRAASLDFEMREDNIPRPIVPPESGKPLSLYEWFDPLGGEGPNEGNWGLRAVRAPAAWNLLDAARVNDQAVIVATEPGAPGTHDDLDISEFDTCVVWCMNPDVGDHAQHVLGIIGARYDNAGPDDKHTLGVVGVNPLGHSTLAIIRSWLWEGDNTFDDLLSLTSYMSTLDSVLGETDAGEQFHGLRAINMSVGSSSFDDPGVAEQWHARWPYNRFSSTGTVLCGPGSNDDDAPTATDPCYPGNLDEYRQDFDDLAEAMVPVLKLAADKGVIIVKSSGNDNNEFCIGPDGRWKLGCDRATDQMLDMSVDKLNPMAAARRLPSAPATSPLLMVESHGWDRRPADSSQPGGDISAPGVDIASTVATNDYEKMSGTSMAAPHVTGAIGYLYTIKPNTTWQTMLAAIKDGARTVPGSTRQLDVFGAAIRLGLLKNVVDINDWSADGNRRVFYGDNQTPIAVDSVGTNTADKWDAQLGRRTSSPDGRIDMRDFRKFRDAWLLACDLGYGGVQSGSVPACPTKVSLDGDQRHPKKDLNGDRCVRITAADCQAPESWYSRFDFNGDGVLNIYRQAPVGITATGGVSSTPTPMTDFDVFKAFFDTSTANTEGWTKNDLTKLLISSDIELGLADFWAAGATSVAVSTFVDGVETGPARTFSKPTTGPGGGIITVPVAQQGSKVELVASANGPDGKPLVATPFVVENMQPGADRRATPCVARIELSFESQALLAGKETGVTAQFVDCDPATARPEVNARSVNFGVQATGTDVPVITTANPRQMDAKGQATATLRAGVGTGTYTVWAELDMPGGKKLRGEAEVTVTDEITISYVWQSALAEYVEEGTSRWTGQPDCEAVGMSYCIDHAVSRIEPEFPGDRGYVVERRGTITATADGIELTERANGGSGLLHADVTWTDLATGVVHDDGVKRYYFELDPADRNRYVNHPVPVEIMPIADEVWVSNLRSIAMLGYRSILTTGGNASAAREINVPHEFFLKPRTDGTSIAFADDVDTVLRFDRTNPNAAAYQWCGTTGRALDAPPGYYQGEWDPWVIGAIEVDRDTQYDPGDVPLMATTGEIRFDVSFAATIATGGETPPQPELPTCVGTSPPNAEFRVVNPAPIEEGEAVQFVDRSTDPDGDIAGHAWDFGGAGSSVVRDPNFGQGFPDEGTYPVTVTVTDGGGRSDSFTQNVTVVNAKPTIEAVSPIVLTAADTPVSVSVLVDDPGKEDRRSLKVTLASSNTKFGGNRVVNKPAGVVRFDLGGLPAGEYPITATVTDDSGQSATTTFTVYSSVVAPEPIPAPPVPPVLVEARGCTSPIPLDVDEAELLARINAQRAAVHQPPLVMSAKLTAAAERHSSDLLATGEVSDTGSDGSSSRDRITDAGYPRTAAYGTWNSGSLTLGEAWANLRQYSEIGTWFGPGMSMIGISRVSDDISTRWVVHVGAVMDCDETPLPAGSAPVASLSAPASIEEGVTVTVNPTSTDPDGDLSRQIVYWGDGTYGGIRHRYADDGTYTITVVAEDRRGNMSHATTQIVVTKTAPEVAITPGRLVVGERGEVVFTVLDIAAADRPLAVEITTDPPHFAPSPSTYNMNNGVSGFALRPTAAGSFTVTVEVTDPDGMVGTATRTFEIDAQAGDPQTAPANVVLPPAPTCATGMEVIGQAAEQLAILNAYRARHGLGALVVVPQLTVAAERHAADMAAHRFFAHEGSDGSTPGSRIRDAGYLGGGGENIALRAVTPNEHMVGWIMSPPHHANILNPSWKAIGIADINGPDGVLGVHVFGDRITCPTGNEVPPEPRVLANPVAGKPTGTLGTAATDAGPIAPTAELPTVPEPPAGEQGSTMAAASTPPAVTALAVVISDRTPEVGQRLTVVNRSRDHGFPRSVLLGTPLTPTDTLGPDATKRFTLLDPGTFTIQLSATGYPNVALAMSLALPVTGDARAPVVQVFGVTGAVSGELVTLRAQVSEANGEPAPGRPVRFSIGAVTSVATTDDAGMATTEMRAELAAGVWPLRAEVLTDAGEVAAMHEITITLGANIAPVAEAGDAYFFNVGDDVVLDGSASYDPDGDHLTYTWDIDADGEFDDASTATPTIDAIDVPALLCGGACESDVEYPIALRVTDAKGGGSEDFSTVTFTRDFAIVIAPEVITITPGSSNSFLVDVVTTSGFAGSVTLSTAGLPAGATVVFTPAAITPGQQSTMTVTLPSDVGGVETIDLAVTGTSGSLVRTANSIVDVVFGLPPRCTTVVEGTVLDAETGDPVVGAEVSVSDANPRRTVITDAQGKWRLEGVSPSTTNQPGPVTRRVQAAGYWTSPELKSTATCDVPLQLVDRLVPVHYVTLRGQVRVGAENPTNPAQLVPTDAVAPNTRVTVTGGNTTWLNNATVDSDGAFEVVVPLGNNNSNTSYGVRGSATDYWPTTASVTASDGSDPFVMVLLRGKCTARITGGRVIDAANVPVPGAAVKIGTKTVVAGPDGWYTIDVDVPMAAGNIGGSASVTAGPPSSRSDLLSSNKTVSIDSCGDVLRVDMVLPFKPETPPVVNVYGKISGVITDVDTGLPVAGAEVKAGDDKATTAADGSYLIDQVRIGTGSVTQANVSVSITRTGYWQESGSVLVRKDETSPFNKAILPIHKGTVSGIVRDQVTGAPLEGAKVLAGSVVVYSDAQGLFTATGLSLGNRNAPANATISAELAGYWKRNIQVQVRDGETVSAQLDLLRECATAEIRGLVVNAETRQPIAGAEVKPTDMTKVTTGPDGRFTITGIKMKSGNTPWEVTLVASAPGFVSQTKKVNVFCGARIDVGFGSLPANPGVITGTVTDAATGAPLGNMFVGTGFGGSTLTSASDGSFRIENVPTNDDGTALEWEVSVVPDTLDPHLPATQVVSVLPGATVTADFALEVPPPPNQAPTAVLTAPAAVAEGNDVTLDGSASSDPEGAPLSFAWDLDGDGDFDDANGATTTLHLAVAGTRTVSVRVTDAAGASAVASAQVVASNVNPTVDAGDDVTLGTDGRLTRTGSFTDPGADTFTATVDFGEGQGSQPLALDGSSFVLDHVYPAGTYTVTVWVYDGHGGSGSDVFAVTVPEMPPPNAVPVAGDVSVTTERGLPVGVTLTGTDADGDTLTYAIVSGPNHGTLSGTAPDLTYIPPVSYTGPDSFTYTVSDGKSVSQPATVSITVVAPPPPPNTVPVAGDVSVTTQRSTAVGVALSGTDADGDALTYEVVDGPAHGVLSGSAPSLTYTPAEGYVGPDSFTYAVSDGKSVSQPATVSITVTAPPPPPNTAPVADAKSVTTLRDTAVAVTLSGSDADGDALTFAVVGGPAHGTLSGSAPSLTYTPAAGYTGADSFTYRVSDGKSVSQAATVSITVTAPPAATAQLLLSDDAARSKNVRPLAGQTLRNGAAMYVFVGPQAVVPTIKQVKFYLDDPQRQNAPFSVEAELSWDFARTAPNKNGCKTCADSPAYPFESNLLSLGTHTVTAVVEFKDGRAPVVLSSSFTVADTTSHQLMVSTKSDRSGAVALAGATLKDKRYIFLGPAQDAIAGANYVRFVLDGNKVIDEALIPYDLKATAADGKANALDTRTLSTGSHTLEAIVTMPEGVTYRYKVTFKVSR